MACIIMDKSVGTAKPAEKSGGGRMGKLYLVLLFAGLATFLPLILGSPILELAGQAIVTVAYFVIYRRIIKSPRYSKYGEISFAYSVFALVVLLNTITLGLASLFGRILIPLVDTPSVILPIVLLTKKSGRPFSSIYLQRGNLGLALKIGVPAFIVTTIGVIIVYQTVFGPSNSNFSYSGILGATPLALVLSFLNAPKEEIWFRGLFLKKSEPFLGANGANLLQAPIFMLAHFVPQYAQFGPGFLLSTLGIALVAGLAWGYLMQKTDSIICSTLSHAGADMAIYLPILLGLLKT